MSTQVELYKDETAAAPAQVTLLDTISAAVQARDIDVEKMKALVELQIRIQERQAEIAFNEAMARLQPKMPRIQKSGAIVVSGQERSRYARYEDIDLAIRPLLSEEGFSISFNTKFQDGKLVMEATISHRLGYSKTSSIVLPIDTSGSKNATQAIGSTVSYGKRYLVCMMLNVVTEGEDDDGNGGSAPITKEQKDKLWALIKELGQEETLNPFLKFMGVAELSDIRQRNYQKGLDALNRKKGAK